MDEEYVNEMFQCESTEFYKKFGDFLARKGIDHWNAKNCTFFNEKESNRRWAWCLFERKGQ